MTELETIRAALADSGGGAVLITLVSVDGSAYRGAGARMVVRASGESVGAISGGCLEKDVAAHAAEVRAAARPRVVTYDLTRDDDKPWGLGLGCNARLQVLLEPATGVPPWLAALKDVQDRREAVVLATVIAEGQDEPLGTRLIVTGGKSGASRKTAAIVERARHVLADGRTVTERGVLYEFLPPPLAVVVCGEGHDTAPLLAITGSLGWHARAVRKDEPLGTLDARTAVIVMTHNYGRDLQLLTDLLPSRAAYIGVLGPRSRTERLLADVKERGLNATEEQLARVHAPVGLDLGAETPQEIALSITAEVRAVFAGRDGGSLGRRTGPIHDR